MTKSNFRFPTCYLFYCVLLVWVAGSNSTWAQESEQTRSVDQAQPASNVESTKENQTTNQTTNNASEDPTQAQPKKRPEGWWAQTMEIPEARWVVWIFITVTLVMLGYYFAKNFREMAFGGGSSGGLDNSDFMTEFGKLRDQGALNDEEYAQLKQTLVQQKTGTKNQDNPITSQNKGDPNSSSKLTKDPQSPNPQDTDPTFEEDHGDDGNE